MPAYILGTLCLLALPFVVFVPVLVAIMWPRFHFEGITVVTVICKVMVAITFCVMAALVAILHGYAMSVHRSWADGWLAGIDVLTVIIGGCMCGIWYVTWVRTD